jgi:F420H(2)-dependent quinone reductase
VKPPDEYAPSSFREIRDQVARYEATDGREGATLNGRPLIILTHRGARSGKLRKTPLMRVVHDSIYVAVASYGGHHSHPAWYYNLLADPLAEVRDGAIVTAVRARQVDGTEKRRLWAVADAAWPDFAEYRIRTDRDIPIFVLEGTT